ncbi:hypothetical protein SAMN04489712_104345 [Thermomonospora echinospora]|uniref:Uncharacterized protein n=1 Tax=Thermomonospora echinospora TaxID=1992 RepID=A0A1H5Z3Q6_9ACTN|nr:hypothetical protein [Thermomonospora echinospora]SEG31209.1 hypothetical protein SAMN04489712_104345 [Thermomonospora echinospora]
MARAVDPDGSAMQQDGGNLISRHLNAAFGSRRLHLAALDAAIVADPHGLACGVVSGEGSTPVLKIIREDRPGLSVDVGCDRVAGRWWFLVEPGGEGVTPVDEVERAPEVLARILGRDGASDANR